MRLAPCPVCGGSSTLRKPKYLGQTVFHCQVAVVQLDVEVSEDSEAQELSPSSLAVKMIFSLHIFAP